MSDAVLFVVGFIVFSVPTTATMWFGYQRFNALYRNDMAADPDAPTLIIDENDFEYRIPRGHAVPAKVVATEAPATEAGS